MEFKGTSGDWKQRRLFETPIFVKCPETNREWRSNDIDIHSSDNRVICSISYMTDSENMGWGHNESIEKWEANANLIAQAPKLLEALQGLVDGIENFDSASDDLNLQNYFESNLIESKEAINKALGL